MRMVSVISGWLKFRLYPFLCWQCLLSRDEILEWQCLLWLWEVTAMASAMSSLSMTCPYGSDTPSSHVTWPGILHSDTWSATLAYSSWICSLVNLEWSPLTRAELFPWLLLIWKIRFTLLARKESHGSYCLQSDLTLKMLENKQGIVICGS